MARKQSQQFVDNSTEKGTNEKCLTGQKNRPKKQTKSEKEKCQPNISQYVNNRKVRVLNSKVNTSLNNFQII